MIDQSDRRNRELFRSFRSGFNNVTWQKVPRTVEEIKSESGVRLQGEESVRAAGRRGSPCPPSAWWAARTSVGPWTAASACCASAHPAAALHVSGGHYARPLRTAITHGYSPNSGGGFSLPSYTGKSSLFALIKIVYLLVYFHKDHYL